MAEKEHRVTLRGVSNSDKKALIVLTKNRKTSINTEILMAVSDYLAEWKKSTPEWFQPKSKKPLTT